MLLKQRFMIVSNIVSKEATNNNEGLMTIVLGLQYIGIDTGNSKAVIKNNHEAPIFIIKSGQFARMAGTYLPNCVKLAPF